MAKQPDIVLLAGGAAAAFAGYEFLYKPWKAKQGASPTSFPTPPTPPATPYTPTPYPYPLPPITPPAGSQTPAPGAGGLTGSIVDPRITPGGDVGQAMWRKMWTETQARQRLDQLKAAYAGGKSNVVELRKMLPDPAAVAAAQSAAAQQDAAAAYADNAAAQAIAAGDALGAAKWQGAAAVYRQDAKEIRNRLAAMPQVADPAILAKIAEWERAMAGHANDYTILTGYRIPGS